MMRFELRLDIFALFIFLGVCQGLFLSYFFLKKPSRFKKENLYLGFLILSMSLLTFDVLLNYTGYMVKVIFIDNFSEPFNFAVAPLFYLYVRNSISEKKTNRDWLHSIPFLIYFFYNIFYYIQPNEFKYNSFLSCYHPDWEYLDVQMIFHDDPLGLRSIINDLTAASFVIYTSFVLYYLIKKYKEKGISFFTRTKNSLNSFRMFTIHFFVVIFVFFYVKLTFERDLGDYFIASYISLLLYIISFNVINKSIFFSETTIAAEGGKYYKSTLSEDQKEEILRDLTTMMQDDKYYKNNLASLDGIAKKINQSKHAVSQVINEKLNKNFFEFLADYRIDEAKQLLLNPASKNKTIDEIAETVGYNSKSAFNNAFKKITGTTPANYRDNQAQ